MSEQSQQKNNPSAIGPPPPRSRLTVIELVYHRQWGEEPVLFEGRFGRELETHEQAYRRMITVGETPQPLDTGWLAGLVGMLVVANLEGRRQQVIPTEQQRAELAAKVIEVGSTNSQQVWLVPPGESFRGWPSSPEQVTLRCQQGKAHCTVFAVPR